jgi:hypothetical protein
MIKKESILTIAIALVFVFFVGYGIETFSPSPEHNDFCPDNLHELKSEKTCLGSEGEWETYENFGKENSPNEKGYCRETEECQNAYDLAESKQDKIVFIVAAIIGLIAIITSVFLHKKVIGAGIGAGGIILIIYGTLRYWQHANDLLKFVLLGIALTILILVGYKKLK